MVMLPKLARLESWQDRPVDTANLLALWLFCDLSKP